jgi:hypothetical protein
VVIARIAPLVSERRSLVSRLAIWVVVSAKTWSVDRFAN